MPIYKGSTQIGKIYKGSTEISKVYHGSTLVYEGSTKTIPVYFCPAYLTAGGNTNYSPILIFGPPTANTTVVCGSGTTNDAASIFQVQSITGTLGTAGSKIRSKNWMNVAYGDMDYIYEYSATLGGYYFHIYSDTQSGMIPFRLYVSPKQKAGDYVIGNMLISVFTCNAAVTGGTETMYYPPGAGLNPYYYAVSFTGSSSKLFDYYYRKA